MFGYFFVKGQPKWWFKYILFNGVCLEEYYAKRISLKYCPGKNIYKKSIIISSVSFIVWDELYTDDALLRNRCYSQLGIGPGLDR